MSKRALYLGLNPSHYSTNVPLTHWPIIQIIPRPLSDPEVKRALHNFEQYTHIIITSKTTVAILKNYLTQLKMDQKLWSQKITLAVGQVTAKHLQQQGIIPTKVAQEETAEGIIDELKQLSLVNAHVFWPHSAQARPLIRNFLITQMIPHTTCILYAPQTQIIEPIPALENFDEIIFTSPSTVEAFLQIFKTFPCHAKLIPIGPITACFLKEKQTQLSLSLPN